MSLTLTPGSSARVDFDAIRERLDLEDVADAEGLKPRKRSQCSTLTFDCPACGKRLKDKKGAAMSTDRVRWNCLRCDEKGDVVDVLRLVRGIEAKDAIRIARGLVGLDVLTGQAKPGDVWKPPPRAPSAPPPEPLDPSDLAERLCAVGHAWEHYSYLAGPWTVAEPHFLRLHEAGAWPPTTRELLEDDFLYSLRMVLAFERARRAPALAYLHDRLRAGLDDARRVVAELVGICPSRNAGLRGYLRIQGGSALVSAGERAGLFRRDGSERFAGRLVYVWRAADGGVAYLTGRAVPALVDVCGIRRDDDGKPIKGEALPVFNPERRGDRLGVHAPDLPFGAHLADRQEGTIAIVEGELSAVHTLTGAPAVATGGSGRMGNDRGIAALRRFLAGRPAIVIFDREDTPEKQQKTDRRAEKLAAAIGAHWAPGGTV